MNGTTLYFLHMVDKYLPRDWSLILPFDFGVILQTERTGIAKKQ